MALRLALLCALLLITGAVADARSTKDPLPSDFKPRPQSAVKVQNVPTLPLVQGQIYQDVPWTSLQQDGWSVCFSDFYGAFEPEEANLIGTQCTGDFIMLACGVVNSGSVQLLSYSTRQNILALTPVGGPYTVDGGTEFYNTPSFSIGFAPAGAPIWQTVCDAYDVFGAGFDATSPLRLCYHTYTGDGRNFDGGWRCGENVGLNFDFTYQRYILTKNKSNSCDCYNVGTDCDSASVQSPNNCVCLNPQPAAPCNPELGTCQV